MILDQDGNPVELPKHRFGQFVLPEGARLTQLDAAINPEEEYPYVPNLYAWIGKEHVKVRAEQK